MTPRIFDKKIYISSKIGFDEVLGTDLYDKPFELYVNVQPTSGTTDIMRYGERVAKMQKALIQKDLWDSYCKKHNKSSLIKEGDLAYLDGVIPGENEDNSQNANYTVLSCMQGFKTYIVVFEKLQKGNQK